MPAYQGAEGGKWEAGKAPVSDMDQRPLVTLPAHGRREPVANLPLSPPTTEGADLKLAGGIPDATSGFAQPCEKRHPDREAVGFRPLDTAAAVTSSNTSLLCNDETIS
jgi:hypothetical protein